MYRIGESLGRLTAVNTHGPAVMAAVLITVILGGCGSSSAKTSSTPSFIVVPLHSSAIHGRLLPTQYTCDGKDISPPLTWGQMPPTVEEVVLFALGVQVLKNGRLLPRVEWAMGGLNPNRHGVRAGEVPRGAFLMRNSGGQRHYSLCPKKGKTGRYGFALYALPTDTRATPRLAGEKLLFNLTGPVPRDRAPAGGAFFATYHRN
jgi:phosphatidylethanolamine-binding protein (PEBP) family uncharacterized protein